MHDHNDTFYSGIIKYDFNDTKNIIVSRGELVGTGKVKTVCSGGA